MNLGGPDSLEAVQPFLFNLFSDPGHHPVCRRCPPAAGAADCVAPSPVAREIYRRLGGASPLLANTEAQARALEASSGTGSPLFCGDALLASDERARRRARSADWAPDEIVCLPLYPQFSTTTTASSLAAWRAAATRLQHLDAPLRVVCCYPSRSGVCRSDRRPDPSRYSIAAPHSPTNRPRLLLTAHGLAEKIVQAGDPYRNQVESTAAAVIAALDRPGLDWRSAIRAASDRSNGSVRQPTTRFGGPAAMGCRLSWRRSRLFPNIRRPWSSSISTIERSAEDSGVPAYYRVPTVGVEPAFIQSLAKLVRRARAGIGLGAVLPH